MSKDVLVFSVLDRTLKASLLAMGQKVEGDKH